MEYWSVDRIEEDVVVLIDDDGNETRARSGAFPVAPREGDMVYADSDRYIIDAQKTAERRQQAIELLRRLLGDA